MERVEVEHRVRGALARLCTGRDKYLLHVNASERSISHRFAVLLAAEFDGYDVDCEYNRNGEMPKALHALQTYRVPSCAEELEIVRARVLPDVVIHTRGTEDNLLAIEIKKFSWHLSASYRHDPRDLEKVTAYIDPQEGLGYKYGLLIAVPVGAGLVEQKAEAMLHWL